MAIDWFTVVAQTINFLILMWLMKSFLYQPIIHAIDEREKLIAKELADADAKRSESRKEFEEFKHKNAEFAEQRTALLKKATEEAKTEHQRLLEEARKAAATLNSKRQETLRTEEKSLHQSIRHRTIQEVFAIARKTLMDLANTTLEERLSEVFMRRLREMDEKTKAEISEALMGNRNTVMVRSAFDLPDEQRAIIHNALNVLFSADIHLCFETAPEMISGIELTANGQRVAWSIADYLAALENGINELLKKEDNQIANVESEPEKSNLETMKA